MEILQEIGSYAGIAAILGLAVLSALYFSQARDVKRLREWAGRAPERAPTAVPESRGVVAQPIARPASRPVPGGTPPPVPRPPGAQPATPGAAAAAAGAAPAVARGPAPATPTGKDAVEDRGERPGADDAGEAGERELDVTAMDTVVHPPPAPLPGDDPGGEGEGPAGGEPPGDPADAAREAGDEDPDGDAAVAPDETAVSRSEDSDEADALDDDRTEDSGERQTEDDQAEDTGEWGPDGDRPQDTGEWGPEDDQPQDTGEWRPEDEHSGIDFTDEHDAVGPATPAPRPPTPPRPYQRRGGPGPATGYAREREPILSPYADARPQADDAGAEGSRGARRPILLAVAALVAIAVVAFGVLQLTGEDDPGSGDGAGLSAGGTTDDDGGSGDSQATPIDPAEVTVAVLNGTTVPGLAATVGDQIQGEGFQLGTVTNNFDQERAESVVLYAPGAEREAADVGRRLDIPQREAIDAESQALAGDASVVVVAGADQNQ